MTKLNLENTSWSLTPLLKDDNDPAAGDYRAEVKKASDAFVEKWEQRSDYLTAPVALAEALTEFNTLEELQANGRDYYYYGLRTSLDSVDANLKAKENQAVEFLKDLSNDLQFFWLRVATIRPELHEQFLAHAGIQPYRHWLEGQFEEAKYRLSEPEERIMTLKSTPAYSLWVQMTSDALSQDERKVTGENGKTRIVTEEELIALAMSKQKSVRDEAAKVFNEMLHDHLDMAVAEMNAILANKKIDDQLRGYDRPDKSRHVADDMESEVVDALIEAVSSRYSISHRFYELRAKLVGLDTLEYHEKTLEYGADDDEYTFPQAATLVHEVFSDLDPQFADIFASFLENGQIDVMPRKGKRSGAFCAHHGIKHPTYVLLNHTDKLRDVMTIAHEMGHAINNELVRAKQNALNFGTPLSTAEVASTFMEDFVVERLLKEADDEMELTLRIRQLDDVIATTFRQVAFYKFEQALHQLYREQGYVSGEDIGRLFVANMKDQLGPAFANLDAAANWWLYVGHFRAFFYVYTYAGGLLVSKAMQAKVRADKAFMTQVKTFLGAGLSKPPKDIFADMGINISGTEFWTKGIDEIEQMLSETEELAKKLKKI